MSRICRLVLLSALALLMVPAAAQARTIGSAGASGDYATAVASGSANDPSSLYVRVTSRPRQRVSVYWSVVCSRGTGAGSKSGDFSGRTNLRRKLRMPMRNPDSCTASASAQLDNGGRLRVKLLAF